MWQHNAQQFGTWWQQKALLLIKKEADANEVLKAVGLPLSELRSQWGKQKASVLKEAAGKLTNFTILWWKGLT